MNPGRQIFDAIMSMINPALRADTLPSLAEADATHIARLNADLDAYDACCGEVFGELDKRIASCERSAGKAAEHSDRSQESQTMEGILSDIDDV